MKPLVLFSAALLLSGSLSAQVCATAAFAIGQPVLGGVTPTCVNALPVPIPVGGNPAFGVASNLPQAPAGSPTFLYFSFPTVFPTFVEVPAPILCSQFGFPGIVPLPTLTSTVTVPAGPAPGSTVTIPFPGVDVAPAGTISVVVQTLAIVNLTIGPCLAISDGIYLSN